MGILDKIWDDVFAGPQPSQTDMDAAPSSPQPQKPPSGLWGFAAKGAAVDSPSTPTSALDRLDSSNSHSTSGSPRSPPTGEIRLGAAGSFGTVKGGGGGSDSAISQRIAINPHSTSMPTTISSRHPPRLSLDSSRSLPTGFSSGHYSPDVASPGFRREENVWRGVFHPGSNKAGMDRLGSSRFDKPVSPGGGGGGAGSGGGTRAPSVYDWYNPLATP